MTIDKENENEHDYKILEIISKFVEPKVPEVKLLITKLTHFDWNKRFNTDDALKFSFDCIDSPESNQSVREVKNVFILPFKKMSTLKLFFVPL